MRVVLLLLVGMLMQCASEQEAEVQGGHPQPIQTVEWQKAKKELPFSLRYPQGWRLEFDQNSGKITVLGEEGERIVIWPFYLDQALTRAGARAVLRRLAAGGHSSSSWEAPQEMGGNMLRMIRQADDRITISSLAWISAPGGTAAFYYEVLSPEDRYAEMEGVFRQIFSSFRPRTGTGSGAQSASFRKWTYRYWQDPYEAAFATEIPAGWSVEGGMYRFAPIDVRPAMQLYSPDREIFIFFGDRTVPSFALPNTISMMTGYVEGTWYVPNMIMIKRYTPGVEFAREYVSRAFSNRLRGFAILKARNRPDAVRGVMEIYQRYGSPYVSQRLDMGDVEFHGYQNQKRMIGYTFVGTSVTAMPSMGGDIGIWRAEQLFGFLAPEERLAEVYAVLAHVVKSFRVNPQWFQMQAGITGNVARITAETNNYISTIITQSYQQRQQTLSNINRRFSNYIRDLVDVYDPATQTTYKVQSGSNYYWIDALENIVGTRLHENPDITRFRQMLNLN